MAEDIRLINALNSSNCFTKNPDWFSLFGASLRGLSWKKRQLSGCQKVEEQNEGELSKNSHWKGVGQVASLL